MDTDRDHGILVVDDDPTQLRIHEEVFSRAGYQVWVANGREQTFAVLASQPVDLVLLDVILGSEDGRDILQEIKKNPDYQNVFVVLVSATIMASVDQSQALELGADGYLTRPIPRRELLARIKAFLRYKRTLDFLQTSQANLHRIIDRNPDAILVVDSEGEIRFANPAAQKLFQKEIVDLKQAYFGYPIVVGEYIDIEIVNEQLEAKLAEMRVIDLTWEDNPAFLTSIRDITERVQLEEKLRHAHKMEAIGQLAGGVAHDFNNILSAISGFAEILLLNAGSDTQQMEYLKKILQSTNRASVITRQLLDFARKTDTVMVNCNVHDSIEQIVAILRSTTNPSITVNTDLQADPNTIFADRSLIENALLNIGLNARDAMPQGGVISYRTRSMMLSEEIAPGKPVLPGHYIEILITDTGVGMDAATKERIFEPFFTTKEEGEGTGLGLSSVYGTIQQHKGYIHIESEPGRGTSLYLYLPVAPEGSTGEQPGEESEPQREASPSDNIRLLLVDDELLIREAVEELLASLGYSVNTVGNCQQALPYYREHQDEIDVIILDMVMPGMSGHDCFYAIKQMNVDAHVVVTSGHSGLNEIDAMLADGAVAFVRKPYLITDLVKAINQALH